MSPWLLLPQSTIGVLPTRSDLTCLSLEKWRMFWLVFVVVVVVLSVVVRMVSRAGLRTGDGNGGWEMENGGMKEGEDGEVMSGGGSSNVVVGRVE